jgi:hypothetical protein
MALYSESVLELAELREESDQFSKSVSLLDEDELLLFEFFMPIFLD